MLGAAAAVHNTGQEDTGLSPVVCTTVQSYCTLGHWFTVCFSVAKATLELQMSACLPFTETPQPLRIMPIYNTERNAFPWLVYGWIFLIHKNFFIILFREPTFIR